MVAPCFLPVVDFVVVYFAVSCGLGGRFMGACVGFCGEFRGVVWWCLMM